MALDTKLQVPEWIQKRGISSEAYSVMQYLVRSETIHLHKWCWSNLAGRDIGTPETVRRILLSSLIGSQAHDLLPADSRSYWGNQENRQIVKDGLNGLYHGQLWDFRRLTVAAYLLGTDFSGLGIDPQSFSPSRTLLMVRQDKDGQNQLEGEIRRYYARETGIKPSDIRLEPTAIHRYCDKNAMQEFEWVFTRALSR